MWSTVKTTKTGCSLIFRILTIRGGLILEALPQCGSMAVCWCFLLLRERELNPWKKNPGSSWKTQLILTLSELDWTHGFISAKNLGIHEYLLSFTENNTKPWVWQYVDYWRHRNQILIWWAMHPVLNFRNDSIGEEGWSETDRLSQTQHNSEKVGTSHD